MQERDYFGQMEKVVSSISNLLPEVYYLGDQKVRVTEVLHNEALLPVFIHAANQYAVILHGKRILPFVPVRKQDSWCGLSVIYNDDTEEGESGGAGFIGHEEMPASSIWSLASFYLSASMREVLINELDPDMPVDLSITVATIIDMVAELPEGSRIPEQDMNQVAVELIKECLEGFERAQNYQKHRKLSNQ